MCVVNIFFRFFFGNTYRYCSVTNAFRNRHVEQSNLYGLCELIAFGSSQHSLAFEFCKEKTKHKEKASGATNLTKPFKGGWLTNKWKNLVQIQPLQ